MAPVAPLSSDPAGPKAGGLEFLRLWGRPLACGGLSGRSHYPIVTLRRPRLPHLEVAGQPLFITFRLHDSLPAQRPFPASNPTSSEAFVTMERWLASIRYGAEIGNYELHSWVIMPHHVHLLLTPQASVSKLPGSLKAATAKRANLLFQRSGQPFWQDESYDRLVRDGDEYRRIQRYIEGNPVTALLACRAGGLRGRRRPWARPTAPGSSRRQSRWNTSSRRMKLSSGRRPSSAAKKDFICSCQRALTSRPAIPS